jgi:hypothetical protein
MIHDGCAFDEDGREEEMLDNSSKMDARIATQMGMTEALRKDRIRRETEGAYYDIRHGQTGTTKIDLLKRFVFHLLG